MPISYLANVQRSGAGVTMMSFVREKKWMGVGLSVIRRGPDNASEVCAKWRDHKMSGFCSPEVGTSPPRSFDALPTSDSLMDWALLPMERSPDPDPLQLLGNSEQLFNSVGAAIHKSANLSTWGGFVDDFSNATIWMFWFAGVVK